MNTSLSVLFRCDGSREIGLGHVMRCLALADELREVHGCQAIFAMRRGPLGIGIIREKGFLVLTPKEKTFNYAEWLMELVDKIDAQLLILDVRDDLSRVVVATLREKGVLIVTLDDFSERRLVVDLAFYPPVPQVQKLDWTEFTGQLHVGWEWVVLRHGFAIPPSTGNRYMESKIQDQKPRILVTMGDSDPAGLTLKAVAALDLLDEDFETTLVLGPGFSLHEALKDLLSKVCHSFEVCQNPVDISSLMVKADLSVASFGVTAYELAAMGVPAIYLCLTEDHAESASVFEEAGMGDCLGVFTQVTDLMLVEAVKHLLEDASERSRMTEQARQRVDGMGTRRIAHMVVARVKRQKYR